MSVCALAIPGVARHVIKNSASDLYTVALDVPNAPTAVAVHLKAYPAVYSLLLRLICLLLRYPRDQTKASSSSTDVPMFSSCR